jgi:hypothetical protein
LLGSLRPRRPWPVGINAFVSSCTIHAASQVTWTSQVCLLPRTRGHVAAGNQLSTSNVAARNGHGMISAGARNTLGKLQSTHDYLPYHIAHHPHTSQHVTVHRTAPLRSTSCLVFVGGNRARRWTPIQQPLRVSIPSLTAAKLLQLL